jgi:nucleotide-binding universal stress UspA family protein
MGSAFRNKELEKIIDNSWRIQLDEALDAVPDAVRGRTETKLAHGSAGPSIVDEAVGGGYDLLIIGTRGLTALGAFFGSVSSHIAHTSPIPVLIVPRQESDTRA